MGKGYYIEQLFGDGSFGSLQRTNQIVFKLNLNTLYFAKDSLHLEINHKFFIYQARHIYFMVEILASDDLLYIFSTLKQLLGGVFHHDPTRSISENSQNLIQLSSSWPIIQRDVQIIFNNNVHFFLTADFCMSQGLITI